MGVAKSSERTEPEWDVVEVEVEVAVLEVVEPTGPVWPVCAAAEVADAYADEAAAVLLAVLKRTVSIRCTTPLEVRRLVWIILAVEEPEVTKRPVDLGKRVSDH